MSQLRTSPTSVEIGTHETFGLGVDCARMLQSGEAVDDGGAPTSLLYDDTDDYGTDVSALNLVGSPSVDGTVVISTLTALTRDRNYRLVTLIHPNAVDYREAVTIIVCPE